MSNINYLVNGPDEAPLRMLLAHSAGAPMDSPFMNQFAEGIAEQGIQVVRFEFPYMAERRTTGKKRPPDRQKVLLETWYTVLQDFKGHNVVVGGKSMGGRIASMIAAEYSEERSSNENRIQGLVCLGYPFHPSGKPEKTRVSHLKILQTPTLILQGERDDLGTKEDVRHYELSPAITIHWLPDGDHSFKPRKSSGITETRNREAALEKTLQFLQNLR